MSSPSARSPQVGDTTNLLLKKLVTATQNSGSGGGVTSITAGAGISVNQATGAVTVTATGAGSGTVTNVSSANANIGVANPTTTPVLTLGSALAGVNSVTSATGQPLTLATLDSNANVVLSPHGTGVTYTTKPLTLSDGTSNVTMGTATGTNGPVLYSNINTTAFASLPRVGTADYNVGYFFAGKNAQNSNLFLVGYGSNAAFRMDSALGTAAAPTAVTSGSQIGSFQWRGYNGTGFVLGAAVLAYTEETFAGAANGTGLSFRLASVGGAAAQKLAIRGNGNVILGLNGGANLGTDNGNGFLQIPSTNSTTGLALGSRAAEVIYRTGNDALRTDSSWYVAGALSIPGVTIRASNAMGALSIDVTKGVNTKTVAVDSTFTFSATPATDTWFSLLVTNSDSSSHVLTIPSSFAVGIGTITSTIIPASGKLLLTWQYDGAAYNLYGASPLTTGTGNFVLANSPTLVTPNLGTPTTLVLTNATGLLVAGGGTGVASLTAYAPIFGGTTSTGAVQSGTAGTAGQLLRSSGAGVIPTWTTPTFPNTATSGKILIGDGTNIVLSTPTYPNAAGTSGNVLASDGTNFVSSAPVVGFALPYTTAYAKNKHILWAAFKTATTFGGGGWSTSNDQGSAATVAPSATASGHTKWSATATNYGAPANANDLWSANDITYVTHVMLGDSIANCRAFSGLSASPPGFTTLTPALSYGFRFATDAADTTHWYYYSFDSNGATTATATTVTVNQDQWYTLATVKVGTTVTFYIDGVSVGTATFNPTAQTIGFNNVGYVISGGATHSYHLSEMYAETNIP